MKALNLARRNLSDVMHSVQAPEALKILDVSGNSIVSLREFEHFNSLEQLDVSNNYVAHLQEVLYLRQLRNLKHLNLIGNLMCQNAEFRLYVIRALPQLRELNLEAIRSDETVMASITEFETPLELPDSTTLCEPSWDMLKTNEPEVLPTLELGLSGEDPELMIETSEAPGYIKTCELETLSSEEKLPVVEQPREISLRNNLVQTQCKLTLSPEKCLVSKSGGEHESQVISGKIKQSNSFERPPLLPEKQDALKHMCELETQERIFESISGLLDLLDNPHLCLLEEMCKGKREGRGNVEKDIIHRRAIQ